MKFRILLVLIMLAAAAQMLAARSDEPYFCTTPGTVLYLERYSAGKHKLIQTTTIEIESVESSGTGKKVNYTLMMRKGNGSPMYGDKAHLSIKVDRNSDFWMDIGVSARELMKGALKTDNVSSAGTLALTPGNMEPGDVLPDSHNVVTALGMKYNIDVTNRTVLRRDRLTTPCGTFECVVVREYKAEVGPGRNKCEWSENWYARGYGYVRHDVFDKNGKLKASETLVQVLEK